MESATSKPSHHPLMSDLQHRSKSQSMFRRSFDPESLLYSSQVHHGYGGNRETGGGTCRLPLDSPSIELVASGGQQQQQQQNCEGSSHTAAYFSWPGSTRLNDTAEERASYFFGLHKGFQPGHVAQLPPSQQAATILDLMTIRAFHSKILRRYSLGTAVGFRMRKGILTDIPAILVFVARKVHRQWLLECQVLPYTLEGPGGVWCDVDVVEFSYYTSPVAIPKEQVYTELVEGLRGSDQCIGPGSQVLRDLQDLYLLEYPSVPVSDPFCKCQVASQETYGTLGTIVKSRTGSHQVGFLTNRHVAVDLDYPNQKMFHPLPPNLGPGVYLGAVERATSFITDELWYGIFASTNPETFVRADGAFVPFADSFDMSKVTTIVKGVGDMGEVMHVNLQAPIGSLIGKHVVKVGRSSGLTRGTILAYALEYNDEKGICFFTDFLVVGENTQAFDLEGDSGSVILINSENGEKPRPLGIIWGGTANRGRLKLKDGAGPENWTSAVDLGRLLDLLQLDLVTSDMELQEIVEEERQDFSNAVVDPTVEEPSPRGSHSQAKIKTLEGCQSLPFEDMTGFGPHSSTPQSGGVDMDVLFRQTDFITRLAEPSTSVELQFMQDFHVALGQPNQSRTQNPENLSELRDGKDGSNDDISIGLQLGDHSTKRRRTSS